MHKRETFCSVRMTMALLVFALPVIVCRASEIAEETQFAAQQDDARKSFKEVVTPFIDNYYTRCHGQNRQKGGINFGPALKTPGETASAHRWKQALAVVKSHDMPPDDVDK